MVNAFGIVPGKPLPNNVVGIKGTPRAFEKAEAELGKLPTSFKITRVDGKLEIRFFQVPENVAVDKFGLASFGLVLLAPGTVINQQWREAESDSEALGSE